LRRVDDSNGPEEDVGGRFAEGSGKLVEVDVVVLGVLRVPGELSVANGDLVAVLRDEGELVRKMLLLNLSLNGVLGELIGGIAPDAGVCAGGCAIASRALTREKSATEPAMRTAMDLEFLRNGVMDYLCSGLSLCNFLFRES
jgi:hypothetical protein